MRLRDLGHGQSVTFMIPQDIAIDICRSRGRDVNSNIKAADVLFWSIKNTWSNVSHNVGLWITQGKRYEDHRSLLNGSGTTREQVQAHLEDESQSLETRYGPRLKNRASSPMWGARTKNEAALVARLQRHEMKSYDDMEIDAEQ